MKINHSFYKSFIQCVCYILCTINLLFSQVVPSKDLKNIVTPSPNASALGQYGNTPVGLYTGTAQLSVPLYEINEGSLKLPISLSYNPGGVKVAEMAPWTGLGWVLNAGGAITRTVYGLPDEGSINASYTITQDPTLGNMKDVLLGRIDAQPDVFYFNFNGKSGKFIIGKTSVISITPHQSLKIQVYRTDGSLADPPFTGLGVFPAFRVTDENGIMYDFKATETNRTLTYDPNTNQSPQVNQAGNPLASINAWYLTNMISPTGDTIKFNYSDYTLDYDIASSEQRYIQVGQTGQVNAQPVQPATVLNVTRSHNTNKRLKQIVFSNGKIVFNALIPRRDLIGDSMLNTICVYSANSKLVKKDSLQYNNLGLPAFYDDNYYQTYISGVSTVSSMRLMLKNVVELDSVSNMIGKKYSFEYDDNLIPSRFSKARDYWGYYNGSADNDNIYLTYQYNGTDPTNIANYLIVGKEPDLVSCKRGTLTKITYPTGGSSTFDYELHDAFTGRGVLPPEVIPQSSQMYIDYSIYSSLGYTDTVIGGVHCKYKTFSVNTGGTNVNISIQGMLPQGPGFSMKFDIYDMQSNTYALQMRDIDQNATKTIVNYTPPGSPSAHQSVNYSLTYFFPNGTYKVIFTPIASYIGNTNYHDYYGYNPVCTIDGWSNVLVHTDTVNFVRKIGGLRLKSMIDYDPVSNKSLQKQYTYKSLTDTTVSSGELVAGVNYIYNWKQIVNAQTTEGAFVALYTYVVINGESNYPLSTTQGSNVGYSAVTVKELDQVTGSVNGKSEYRYSSPSQFPDFYGPFPGTLYYSYLNPPPGTYSPSPGPINPYPYVPADTRDWQRGLLLEKSDYRYNGTFNKIRNEVYNYSVPVYTDTMIGYLTRYAQQLYPGNADTIAVNIGGGGTLAWQEVFATKVYGFSSGYRLLLNKVVTETGDNAVALASTESYNYGGVPFNMLPTTVTAVNSKNQTTITNYKYPFDYSVASPANTQATGIFNLQQKHIITPVIESFTSKTDNAGNNPGVISGLYQTFKATLPLPDTVLRLELTQPILNYDPVAISGAVTTRNASYKPVVAFSFYDNKGNILERSKINDVKEVYLFGYNSRFPVAKILNSTYAIASTKVTQAVLDNPTDDVTLRTHLNNLRTIPGALVTTYTYAPLIGVTSETDPAGKTTFYEYDSFNRLKNIKDYQGNIVKNFQYNYANSCGANCVVLPMQTFISYNTPSYPVGVFNGAKQYIGIATTPAQYVTLWNSNAANQALGVLSTNADSMHFNLSLATNAVAPPALFGLRYYQWVGFAQSNINIASDSLSYIDWGDGNKELLTSTRQINGDTGWYSYAPVRKEFICYMVPRNHTYTNGLLNTLTVFHNETTEMVNFNSAQRDDSIHLSNIRGNYPEKVKAICYDYMPSSSDTGVLNYNKLTEVLQVHYQQYGSYSRHNSWQSINNFHKLRWLKMGYANGAEVMSNLRVNFPNLEYLECQLNKPDITQTWGGSGFPNLYILAIGLQSGGLSTAEIDLILNSQGLANSETNGLMGFAPVPFRSAVSDAAYNSLIGRGWNISVNNNVSSCGTNCVVLPMQTFTSYNTPSYPVGVFNGAKQYIGIATTPAQYVTLWNSNAANQALGVLSTNADSMHFNLSLAANAVAPPALFGLRYYQWVGFSQTYIYISSDTLSFIDWGDGNQELLTTPRQINGDSSSYSYAPVRGEFISYIVRANHTYSSSLPKTLTVFHNETTETVDFNSNGVETTSYAPDIRGYYPEKVKSIGYHYITNSSDTGIINFNKLTEVLQAHYQQFGPVPTRHNSWQSINNFHKLKWLKMGFINGSEVVSNLRSNFPDLRFLEFEDNKPDITQTWSGAGFPNLYILALGVAPAVITTAEIDLILNSQASANTITNGGMGFVPVPVRSAASNTAFSSLQTRGWILQITSP